MNHSASRDWARTLSSVASPVRTTRMTPSAPSPACRSAIRCTWAGVSSREPSRSGTSTKSFSVPWPLVKRVMSAILRYAAQRPRIRLANRRERLVEQVGCLGVQPGDAWVRTEPRLLPACVAASGLCGVAAGRHLVQFAVEDGDGLAVADGPAGGDTVAQSLRQERLRLAPEALPPHPLDPTVDVLDENLPLEAQPEHHCRTDELTGRHGCTEGTAGE